MNNQKVVFLCMVFLMGCTSLPKEIQVANNQQLVNFSNVSDQAVGKMVRWGGVITDLREQEGVANVTVTQYPLLRSGQPTTNNQQPSLEASVVLLLGLRSH